MTASPEPTTPAPSDGPESGVDRQPSLPIDATGAASGDAGGAVTVGPATGVPPAPQPVPSLDDVEPDGGDARSRGAFGDDAWVWRPVPPRCSWWWSCSSPRC